MRKTGVRFKGDEPILGNSEFVEQALKSTEARLERRYALQAKGLRFSDVVTRVAKVLNMNSRDVLGSGKAPETVRARSLLCYWANREMGMTTIELAGRLNICQSTVSRAVTRGQEIAARNNFSIE